MNEEQKERFWSKVDKRGRDECWEWKAAKVNGYGRFGVNRASRVAHRLAWELAYGPVEAGIDVCHRCDNRACCNLSHLFLGTRQDNVDDMMRKGRYGARLHPKGEAHPMCKLSDRDVERIRLARGRETAKSLAARYGVCADHVHKLWQGRLRRHAG